MSSDEEPISEEFVLKWVIEDFHMCPFQNNEFIKSPEITLKSFNNTTWYLKVCPREATKKNIKNASEYISCYLVRAKTDGGPRSITVSYKMSVNTVVKKFGLKPFESEKESGAKFLKRESRLICSDLLDIECYMSTSADYSTNEENNTEASSSTLTELTEIKQFPFTLKSKDSSLLRNRCYVHSKISVENRSFICPINNIDRRLPTLSFMEDYNLTATLNKKKNLKDNKYYLSADIRFKEELNENLLTVFSMHILDFNGEICMSTEDEYLFIKTNENEVWHFSKPFLWKEVERNRNSHLCFEFSVSNGQISSNLEWLVNDSYHPKFSNSKYLPKCFLNEMFRFYKNSKYCDLILKTEDKEFKCHKTVLSAHSSKLAAIFESGMNIPNIIPIEDLDSETMSRLIDIMYTSKVENLEVGEAAPLVAAAEKYKIDSLKRNCCDLFAGSISLDNVCDVLLVSYAVQDEYLNRAVISFISLHKNKILYSFKWKILANKFKILAYETVMKLSNNNCNKAEEAEGNRSD